MSGKKEKKVRRMKVKGLINQMKKVEKRVMGVKVIALKRVMGMKVKDLKKMMIVDKRRIVLDCGRDRPLIWDY